METTSTKMISELYEIGIISYITKLALLLQIKNEKKELLIEFMEQHNNSGYANDEISMVEIDEFLESDK